MNLDPVFEWMALFAGAMDQSMWLNSIVIVALQFLACAAILWRKEIKTVMTCIVILIMLFMLWYPYFQEDWKANKAEIARINASKKA